MAILDVCRLKYLFLLLLYVTKGYKLFFLLIIFCSIQSALSQASNSILQNTVNVLAIDPIPVGGSTIKKKELVVSFYRTNGFALAWNDRITISIFLTVIQRADEEGLNPIEYHLLTLKGYYHQELLSEVDRVYFDILLTDAFMLYGSHLLCGKTDPTTLYSYEWKYVKRAADLVSMLNTALQEGSIAQTIGQLIPQYKDYIGLKESLLFYERIRIAGGWPFVPEGDPLDSGMVDFRIPFIRTRLSVTGQLHSYSFQDSVMYDSVLVSAVKKFQLQYGLFVDGVIGKNTLLALNLTVDDHIEKIKANMERYRWGPVSLEEAHLIINIPSFQLEMFESDSLIISMKAIVGRPDRRTPVLQSNVQYLILNPTWTVPPTILREDALPAIRQSLKYLNRNNLRVFNRKGEEVDPSLLPWEKYTERNFPYQLIQDPGPNNSLGLIKFQFPNNHRVFLHDTNHPYLFTLTNRALSSGCIRIEHPFELATYLLQGTSWTSNQILRKMESKKTVTIKLPSPIPIYTVYFTAFVNKDSVLQLRNDIYDWDRILIDSLSDSKNY